VGYETLNKKTMKKISVTIGIPAFNEEKNIGNLLKSILAQRLMHASLDEIIIISDGSTDKTVKKIKEIRDERITVHEGKKRVGKPQRLNQLFKLAKGDIIVLLDSDINFTSPAVLEHLLIKFWRSKKIGMVSGKAEALNGANFVQNAINITRNAYLKIAEQINSGNNLYACEGRILALSKSFAQTVTLPSNIIATDAFLYFSCIKNGFAFRYASSAVVRFISPNTFKEQITQNKRFSARTYILKSYFGDIVDEESKIPRNIYIKNIIPQVMRYPVHSFVIFFVNLYSKYLAKKQSNTIGSLWTIAHSTKRGIAI